MTLALPAWHATLTNHTRGWSYVTYQGQEVDPDDPVRLTDNWTAEWSHRDAQQWEHLDPVSTTVHLAALDVDDLPLVDYDDEMSLRVVRITVGDPIVWFHAFGGVSDLDASADFQTEADLTLTFVDPRAALGTRTHVPTADPFEWNMGMGTIRNIHPGTVSWGPLVDVRYIDGVTFADVMDIYANRFEVPGWATWRMAHRIDPADLPAGAEFYGPLTPYRFYFDFWPVPALAAGDGMPALFELGVDSGVLTVGDFDADEMPSAMTVLPASAIRSPVPWKKDPSNGEVAVDATGVDDVTKEEISVVSSPPRTTTKTTRVTLPTNLGIAADILAAADHRRELRKESRDWRTPSMTLDTNLLTDAQVDYLADGRLWPRQLPYDIDRGVAPMVVVGAARQSNLGGALIIGLPVGGKFTITRGRLMIDLDISAWSIRDSGAAASVPGPTYAQVYTAFPTIDYDHVDPGLTYDDLKLATI